MVLPGELRSNGNGHHMNGKRNGHHSSKRRRVFDYQRYYSDLMLQVSDRSYERKARERNGSEPSKHREPPQEKVTHADSVSTNKDLIASQKSLIEEQQRLIQEQTKLIEEKTKLIHEKSQLLEKQTELFGNGIY
jgi:hypothetical protein